MKKKVFLAISFILVLIISASVVYRRALFQRGNPLPYIRQMLTLRGDNQFSKVFPDKDIYLTRNSDDNELIKHIESSYEVTFSEQMGSAFLFDADDKTVIATIEVYWRKYLVWEINISMKEIVNDIAASFQPNTEVVGFVTEFLESFAFVERNDS